MPVIKLPELDTSLRVGGFEPFTTLDYPGHLAAVVFCQGCPLRCLYCHNTDLLPVRRDTTVKWANIRTHLKSRRGLLDGVVFSGGEPLMQSALPGAIDEVHALGYSVALHTAGTTPKRLERVLDQVDWVGLDIKASPDDYVTLTGISAAGEKAWKSLSHVIDAGVGYEVRTTVWPDLLGPDKLRNLARQLVDAGVRHWVLQESRDPSTRNALGGEVILDTALHEELAATFETLEVRRAS